MTGTTLSAPDDGSRCWTTTEIVGPPRNPGGEYTTLPPNQFIHSLR